MITVRPGTPDDLEDVVGLWHRAGGPTRQASGLLEAHRLLVHDPGSLVVAVCDGLIVGTLIVGWDGWRCHLYRLAVDQGSRRTGVARVLVEEAVQRANAIGATRLDAIVDLGNGDAIAFWESTGFQLGPDDGRWSMVL